jgi:hypothetical protein
MDDAPVTLQCPIFGFGLSPAPNMTKNAQNTRKFTKKTRLLIGMEIR